MFLLDTNTCIQLWQRKNLTVRKRFSLLKPTEVALCSVVKAELLLGAHKSQNRDSNLQLLKDLFLPLSSFQFDDEAAEAYGIIRYELESVGKVIGANDLMIASIAKANKLTLVTHNTNEFSRVKGLSIEDWEL